MSITKPIKPVTMGTTMSSVGLANKPPALPPVKQNNTAVSGRLFLTQTLFIFLKNVLKKVGEINTTLGLIINFFLLWIHLCLVS